METFNCRFLIFIKEQSVFLKHRNLFFVALILLLDVSKWNLEFRLSETATGSVL